MEIGENRYTQGRIGEDRLGDMLGAHAGGQSILCAASAVR
jgi:hypothetical protein